MIGFTCVIWFWWYPSSSSTGSCTQLHYTYWPFLWMCYWSQYWNYLLNVAQHDFSFAECFSRCYCHSGGWLFIIIRWATIVFMEEKQAEIIINHSGRETKERKRIPLRIVTYILNWVTKQNQIFFDLKRFIFHEYEPNALVPILSDNDNVLSLFFVANIHDYYSHIILVSPRHEPRSKYSEHII